MTINLRGKNAPKLLTDKRMATESARAEMYCDLFRLELAELAILISKDRMWGKLQGADADADVTRRRSGCFSGVGSPRFVRGRGRSSRLSGAMAKSRDASPSPTNEMTHERDGPQAVQRRFLSMAESKAHEAEEEESAPRAGEINRYSRVCGLSRSATTGSSAIAKQGGNKPGRDSWV